jgi:hypothetical protein
MSPRTPDTYFSSRKMEKRAVAADRTKSIRASEARVEAKQLKVKIKRKR